MRMIMALVAAVFAGPGCDQVFRIDHVAPMDGRACNAVGHDEDQDGLDDACDPCPFADDNGVDPDGDHITGICDPDPATPNERILFFGFGDASMFTVSQGRIVDDAFHTYADSYNSRALWNMPVDDAWIMVGVDVVRESSIDTLKEIGVIADAVDAGADSLDGTYCLIGGVSMFSKSPYIHASSSVAGVGSYISGADTTLSPSGMVGGTIRVAFGRSSVPRMACTFTAPRDSSAITATRNDTPALGSFALWSNLVEVNYTYVFIVTRP